MESDGDEQIETVIIAGDYGEFGSIAGNQLRMVQNVDDLGIQVPKDGHASNAINVTAKSKYYKQTYRTAWEDSPDFKGWLQSVPEQPTRAYCTYCQRSLHAHRLSLLKHTCTMRHQRAAQQHQSRRKDKDGHSEVDEAMDDEIEMDEEELGDELTDVLQEEEDEDNIATVQIDGYETNIKLSQLQKCTSALASPISTHVVDTCIGKVVSGLQVSLYKLIDGKWAFINEASTNSEGRLWQIVDRKDFTSGRYKLHFDVDRYFESKNQESMFPFIEVVFNCAKATDNYHIALLII